MIIDTHLHERTYSKDSELGLLQIVHRAQRMGLDGICITDHESNGLTDLARHMAREMDYPIIVGAEVYTDLGDILCFGLKDIPTHRIPVQELLDRVEAVGGTTIAAHPYRTNNRGLKDSLLTVRGLGAVEGFNGSTDYENNLKAMRVAESLDLPITGASDAHFENKIGGFATWFPEGVRTSEDLIEAVRSKQIRPVVHMDGRYQSIGEYIEGEREIAV